MKDIEQNLFDACIRHFNKINKFLSSERAEVYSLSEGQSTKKIHSLLGTFDNDIILGLIECMLIQGYMKLGTFFKNKLDSSTISVQWSKELGEKVSEKLKADLSEYKCLSNESSSDTVSDIEIDEFPDLSKAIGVDLAYTTRAVQNLSIHFIDSLYKELCTKLDLWELERRNKLVFKLSNNVSDDELLRLYETLTNQYPIMFEGDKVDFLNIMRGKGDGGKRLRVNKPATLLTLIQFFLDKNLVEADTKTGDYLVCWEYISDNFNRINGKSLSPDTLRKNKKNANTKALLKILSAFWP
jgi:hypothetical protein